jgi:glycosyltransferase involved in cell wall biosynthesis
MALAGDGVGVSGTVPDVRPYLQHAAVVVAPLRLARGLQNKVLEAMAMARPVVAAGACVEAIDVRAGEHLLSAETANDYVQQVGAMLSDATAATALGLAGRQRVLDVYSWAARLGVLDQPLAAACSRRPAASLSATALDAR